MKISIITLTVILLCVLAGCGGGASIENVRWILVSYGDPETPYAVLTDTDITARFNSGTKELRGNGGCNHYTGEYEIEGKNLTVKGALAVTEMWCGDEVGAQESAYLDILVDMESYELDGDILRIDCGNKALYYEREET